MLVYQRYNAVGISLKFFYAFKWYEDKRNLTFLVVTINFVVFTNFCFPKIVNQNKIHTNNKKIRCQANTVALQTITSLLNFFLSVIPWYEAMAFKASKQHICHVNFITDTKINHSSDFQRNHRFDYRVSMILFDKTSCFLS